mmetsp:Transcript_920/g.1916  ORF Transcript_920/g.1916 Transcript_920/m.1916 type:complete len:122 (+) Transcript_920:1285-1650(+)
MPIPVTTTLFFGSACAAARTTHTFLPEVYKTIYLVSREFDKPQGLARGGKIKTTDSRMCRRPLRDKFPHIVAHLVSKAILYNLKSFHMHSSSNIHRVARGQSEWKFAEHVTAHVPLAALTL